jgi:hypothetical protein
MSAVVRVFAIVIVGSGCLYPNVVPPPPVPTAEAPLVSSLTGEVPPQLPDSGVVVIDLEPQGRAFDVVTMKVGEKDEAVARPLCDTPCAATLPLGKHTLTFDVKADPTLAGFAEVVVSPQPQLVRHRQGRNVPQNLIGVVGGYTVILAVVGLVLANVVGLIALPFAANTPGGLSRLGVAYGGACGISFGVLAVGWLFTFWGQASAQQGSTSITPLPSAYLESAPQ